MRALFVIALLLVAAPALAQERSPAERQVLVDLAYVLGESHALRQTCAGQGDQHWRTRMIRLVETEAPDAAFEDRLKSAFNNGFAARRTEHPACGPDVRRAEAAAARRGGAIAARLASTVHVVRRMGPDAEAPPADLAVEEQAPR